MYLIDGSLQIARSFLAYNKYASSCVPAEIRNEIQDLSLTLSEPIINPLPPRTYTCKCIEQDPRTCCYHDWLNFTTMGSQRSMIHLKTGCYEFRNFKMSSLGLAFLRTSRRIYAESSNRALCKNNPFQFSTRGLASHFMQNVAHKFLSLIQDVELEVGGNYTEEEGENYDHDARTSLILGPLGP